MRAARSAAKWIPIVLGVLVLWRQPVAAATSGSSLISAVRSGDHQAINALLKTRGVDVNAAPADGTTALHWAAHAGDLDAVNRLIAAGAKVQAVNRYGIAPLWLAAEGGHGRVVEALLRAGADPDTPRGDSGETVVMSAARTGQAEVLQRLIAFGADVNARDKIRNQSALIWAAGEGHAAAVRVLAEAGADLEARSSSEMTPLMFGIRSGDVATARELLDQGADLKAVGSDGTTSLALAILNANWEMAAFLVNRGADANGDDPVHGRPLQVLAFVRRAENRGLAAVLPRRPSGNISAIELGNVLIAHGARVNDRIDWKSASHTPPHLSMPFFFTISYVGATPFFIAAKNCDLEFMKFLIANGADPQIPTVQRITPLLAAAGVGHSVGESPETEQDALDAVAFLRNLGSDLNAVSDFGAPQPAAGGAPGQGQGQGNRRANPLDGAGALHGAVAREAPELVKWLIAQGAPLDQKNKAGQTALDTLYVIGLSTTRITRDAMAETLRAAMVAKGLPVPAALPADTAKQ
jgi:ankyrin repeat protein